MGLVFYAVFLAATTLHEAAHAWAALRGGDPTAYRIRGAVIALRREQATKVRIAREEELA